MVWRYDLADLTDAASGLAALQADYASATDDREAVSASFGSEDVSGAVEEFVDSWSDKRRQQLDSLENAVVALEGIIDTYVQLDQNGVQGLQQPSTP